jgi:hypothetical protein
MFSVDKQEIGAVQGEGFDIDANLAASGLTQRKVLDPKHIGRITKLVKDGSSRHNIAFLSLWCHICSDVGPPMAGQW